MPAALPESVDQLLRAIVRIDSINTVASGRADAEAELIDFLETIAAVWGLATRRLSVAGHADNLLLTHEVSSSAPWIMFESHVDTVAVEGMTIDPFGGEIRDGKLFGRGSCDTKGSGAAMLWALKQYADSASTTRNVALHFTVDEEAGMTGVQQLVRDWPTLNFTPVGVIVGEPTLLAPVCAHPGVVRWEVTTRGRSAHSSMPHLGASAVEAMSRVLHAIYTDYIPSLPTAHPVTGKPLCTVNVIRGGSQINVVPDRCTIHIDRRTTPDEALDQVAANFETFLARLRDNERTLDLTTDIVTHKSVPALGPHDDAVLGHAVTHALEQCGLPADVGSVAFSTDAGFLSAAGIPCVVLGPGDPHHAHTEDESITLDQLRCAVEIYHTLMTAPVDD